MSAPEPLGAERLVPRPRFRADIEGLRAVAVLLVVLYHAGVPGFGGGYVGVDVFFVLSGYLITWLLVHEAEETGTVDFVRFYARRARRLLPAVAVVLVATVAVGAFVLAPFEQRDLARSAGATAAYLSNVFFARRATDYLGAAAEDNPFLHTWSLSVEEQFYVVWPVFVLFALGALGWQRRAGRGPSRGRLVGWMAAVAAVSFAASVWLTGVRQPWAFFLSPLRAWEFAAGALGVLIGGAARRGGAGWRLNPGRVGAVEGALGWAGLAAIVAVGALYRAETPFPGWAALAPVAATVLALRAGTANAETALARALAWRPLQEIGRLSYSWYLWHWPVLVYADVLGVAESLPARLGWLALSLILAEASYRFVENPVRHHPALAGRAGRSLATMAALTAVGVGLSVAWGHLASGWAASPRQASFTAARDDVPTIYASGCHADFHATVPAGCAFGEAGADTTVVLFGDSHAAHWFPAVRRAAAERGWQLVSLTKSSCPPPSVPLVSPALGRPYAECGAWREAALARIDRLRPAVVVTSGSADYVAAGGQPGVSVEAWGRGTARTFGRLSASAGHVLHFEDTPRPDADVPRVPCPAGVAGCRPPVHGPGGRPRPAPGGPGGAGSGGPVPRRHVGRVAAGGLRRRAVRDDAGGAGPLPRRPAPRGVVRRAPRPPRGREARRRRPLARSSRRCTLPHVSS